MKTRTIEVYNCDHCNKLYLKKLAATWHELSCKRNPANNRPCFSCHHLTKSNEQAIAHCNEEEVRSVEVLFCSKRQVCLYTPVNEIKGNRFELVDNSNEPMPRECKLYLGTGLPDSLDEFNSKFSFLY